MTQMVVKNSLTEQQNINNTDISAKSDLTIVLGCLVRQLIPFSPQPAVRQAQLLERYITILQAYQQQLQTTLTTTTLMLDSGTITSGGLVNLDWIKPFVDCQSVSSFPGLALSTLAYGQSSSEQCEKQSEVQPFLGNNEFKMLGNQHPIFPTNASHLFVCSELQQILFDRLQKEFPKIDNSVSHFDLFCNEFTNNEMPSQLPAGEPFIVRLGLQNPFPFPMIIKHLCLSIDKVKLRPGSSPPFTDKYQCSVISELKMLPGVSNQPQQQRSTITAGVNREKTNKMAVLVDLQVMPGPEVESFLVDGIKFDLCAPIQADSPQISSPPSISAFVPISIRGKRLFKTKEERISKLYAVDSRLKANALAESAPLLSFRPIGGDPGFIKAINQWLPLEGHCDQIVQNVFEIENVGKISVRQLRFCTNLSEQVSISEPSTAEGGDSRWSQCPAKSQPTALFSDDPFKAIELGMESVVLGEFTKTSANNPLTTGGKIGMRVAIRMEERSQLFYFIFLYIGENGQSRQFRFAVQTRPLPRILAANLRSLSPSIGLCMLELHCLPLCSQEENAATATAFAKLELLGLAARLVENNGPAMVGKNTVTTTIRRVDNKPIQLESATKQNMCFYVSVDCSESGKGGSVSPVVEQTTSEAGGWAHSWLGQTFVPDTPLWQIGLTAPGNGTTRHDLNGANLEKTEQHPLQFLQLKLLWKASIVRSDGTVNTVFGELIVRQK